MEKLRKSALMQKTTAKVYKRRRVFEDTSGRRERRLLWIVSVTFLLVILVSGTFYVRLLHLPNLPEVTATQPDENETDQDVIIHVLRNNDQTDCGQGIFRNPDRESGIAGFVPFGDETSLTALRAHCAELEAVYYEAFTFGPATPAILALGPQSAAFPLPEFQTGSIARNRPLAFPVVSPGIGTSSDTVNQMLSNLTDGQLRTLIGDASDRGIDGGVCLNLMGYTNIDPEALGSGLRVLRDWLGASQLMTCLIGDPDAPFWENADIRMLVDKAVVAGFLPDGARQSPIAPFDWFETQIGKVQQSIPLPRLSVAFGAFASARTSGQRNSVQMPFAEAMFVAAAHDGRAIYAADAGNLFLSHADASGRLTQTWLQDASVFQNQSSVIDPEVQITLWPLGYEDPSIWQLIGQNIPAPTAVDVLEAPVEMTDLIAVDDTGLFLGRSTPSLSGQRQVDMDPTTGLVTDVRYRTLPQPRSLGFFASADTPTLALTFSGLGDDQTTRALLNHLHDADVKAAFLLTANELIFADDEVLNRIVDEGHYLGTSTGSQVNSKRWAVLQNNLAQQRLAHAVGRRGRFVLAPFEAGRFTDNRAALDHVTGLLGAGYVPVRSNVEVASGAFDPDYFYEQVYDAAVAQSVNIVNFNFAEGNTRNLLGAMPAIISNLQADGFEIRSLESLAQVSASDAQPASDLSPDVVDHVMYPALRVTWVAIESYLLIMILTVAFRPPLIIGLSLLRKNRFPLDETYTPAVTVIVPAFNEEKVIEKTIHSILACDYPDVRVAVVDDGSSDATSSVVKRVFGSDERVTLYREENSGKWFAENTAIERIDTDIFVVVDADTMLHPDALKYIVQPFKDEKTGAVSGLVELGNRENFWTACQAIEYRIAQSVLRRAYEVIHAILIVPGAIGAWRRSAVIKAGMVSGDTITEDADLTLAIHRADYDVHFVPEARSFTEVPTTLRTFYRQRLRWVFGLFQVIWKHKRSITDGYIVGIVSVIDAIWNRLIESVVHPIFDVLLLIGLYSFLHGIITEGTTIPDEPAMIALFVLAFLPLMDFPILLTASLFEKKSEWRLFFVLPFLRFGYRQVLYFSVLKSIYLALAGRLTHWNKLKRSGTATIRD